MKPRIPARPFELVQLGFLLPWAAPVTATRTVRSCATRSDTGRRGTASASASASVASASSVSRQAGANHAESSAMAAARSAQRPTASDPLTQATTELPVRATSGPPVSVPQSYIHHILSTPNPPSPADLLLTLRANPRLLSFAAGKALAAYAERVDDRGSAQKIWKLMMEQRLAPIGLATRERSRIRAKRKPRKRALPAPTLDLRGEDKGEEVEWEEGEEEYDGYFQVPRPVEATRYPVRPNRWATKNLPPLESLATKRFTTNELLRHMHCLLLKRSAMEFEEAVDMLKAVDNDKAKIGDKGTREDGRISNEAEAEKKGYKIMALLHLYLAYLPETQSLQTRGGPDVDPMDLVDLALERGGKVNKQTLHLSVRALLVSASRTRLEPTKTVVEDQDTGSHESQASTGSTGSNKVLKTTSRAQAGSLDSNAVACESSPHMLDPSPPRTPTPSPGIQSLVTRTLATISHYRLVHAIQPGPETYRHLAMFAATHNLIDVGQVAWRGWSEAMRAVEARKAFQEERAERPIMGLAGLTTESLAEGEEVDEVRIRFRRIGTMRVRWLKVVGLYKEKGWIVRTEGEGPDGYAWAHNVQAADIESNASGVGASGRVKDGEEHVEAGRKRTSDSLKSGREHGAYTKSTPLSPFFSPGQRRSQPTGTSAPEPLSLDLGLGPRLSDLKLGPRQRPIRRTPVPRHWAGLVGSKANA